MNNIKIDTVFSIISSMFEICVASNNSQSSSSFKHTTGGFKKSLFHLFIHQTKHIIKCILTILLIPMFISSLLNYSYIAICLYVFVEMFLYLFIANVDIHSSIKVQNYCFRNYYISEINCKLNKKISMYNFGIKFIFNFVGIFDGFFLCVVKITHFHLQFCMFGICFTIIEFHKKLRK